MKTRLSSLAAAAALLITAAAGCGGHSSSNGGGGGSQCVTAGPLTSSPISNNAQQGNMFDVVAIHNVVVTSLTVNLPAAATNIPVEIYHRAGTHVGHETVAADWALVGSATINGSATGPAAIPVVLDIPMTAGDTHAFYVTATIATTVGYTDGTAVGNVAAVDANLELDEGTGNGYPFAGVFQPRIWIGTIGYAVCP